MTMTVTWRLEAADANEAVRKIAEAMAERARIIRHNAEHMRGFDAQKRKTLGLTLEHIACRFTEAATLEAEVRWLRNLTVESPNG